jgi:hypothetical protein
MLDPYHQHVCGFLWGKQSGIIVSPTGGLIIALSASRFAMMAAATAQSQYLFHIIPE